MLVVVPPALEARPSRLPHSTPRDCQPLARSTFRPMVRLRDNSTKADGYHHSDENPAPHKADPTGRMVSRQGAPRVRTDSAGCNRSQPEQLSASRSDASPLADLKQFRGLARRAGLGHHRQERLQRRPCRERLPAIVSRGTTSTQTAILTAPAGGDAFALNQARQAAAWVCARRNR